MLPLLSLPVRSLAEGTPGGQPAVESSPGTGIAVELPAGESRALWEDLIARSAQTQGDPHGTIRIASKDTKWTVEAEDVHGQIRSAPVERPLSDESRYDISILAVSLLRPALEPHLAPGAGEPVVDITEALDDAVAPTPVRATIQVRPRIALTPALAVRNTVGAGFSLDLLGGVILPRGMQLELQGGLVFPGGGPSAAASGPPWEAAILAGASWDRGTRVSPVIGLCGGVDIARGRFGSTELQTVANPIVQLTVGLGFAAGAVVRIQPLAQLRLSPAVDTGSSPGAPVQVGGVFGVRVQLSPPASPRPAPTL